MANLERYVEVSHGPNLRQNNGNLEKELREFEITELVSSSSNLLCFSSYLLMLFIYCVPTSNSIIKLEESDWCK